MNRAQLAKKIQELEQIKCVYEARKGLKDLFYFNKFILEQDEHRRENIVPHVHGEWANWHKESKSKYKLILVPRGSLKSSFFTVGGTIQMIAQNRNVRIAIASATIDRAQSFLSDIKNHLQFNEKLIQRYGQFYDKNLKWNENEIEVVGRKPGIREPTVVCIAVGSNVVGGHCNHIWWDDLVDDRNVFSREQALKTLDWWEKSQALPDSKGGTGTLIGTRWAHFDLYQHIIDNLGDTVDTLIRSAYNQDGSPYFPELLDEQTLEHLKSTMHSKTFSSFYLNHPVDSDTQLVKSHNLHTYPGVCRACGKEHKIPSESRMTKFVGVDPAVSLERDADETAMVSIGVDTENTVWVLWSDNGKYTKQQMIDKMFAIHRDIKPDGMAVETIGQAQMLLEEIHDQEDARNYYLSGLIEVKSRDGLKKSSRLESVLQTKFERNKVIVRNDLTDLIAQLSTYPSSKHDDLLDALSDAINISFTPDGEKPQEKIPATLQERAEFVTRRFSEPQYLDPVLGDDF